MTITATSWLGGEHVFCANARWRMRILLCLIISCQLLLLAIHRFRLRLWLIDSFARGVWGAVAPQCQLLFAHFTLILALSMRLRFNYNKNDHDHV